ncbi:MAG TPA: glycosyltransferase family 87 protein [Acetobacteraceae bacterium]|nr:glycosyltransferase family 87 protein [Acetobacteraceae bacterium]
MLRLCTLGLGLVGLTALGLAMVSGRPVGNPGPGRTLDVVLVQIAAGLLYLAAAALVLRGKVPARALWVVLGAALAMRALLLPIAPPLSSDLYRYVWDGRVQAAGINPYRFVPADPRLAFLRDRRVFPHINRVHTARTIYPPMAELAFRLAAWLAPGVGGMKAVMLGCDLVTIGGLLELLRLAGRPAAQVLLYAWAPMPIWEFAGNGHVDAVAAALVTLALLAGARARRGLAGMLLAAATLVKFLPAAVVPAFWRRWDFRLLAAYAATVGLLYAPYLGVGARVLGFLPGYATQEGLLSGHGVFLLDLLRLLAPLPRWTGLAYAAALAVVMATLALSCGCGPPLPTAPQERVPVLARQAVVLGAVALVGISPHYPWYLGWLVPLVCLAPSPALLYLVAASVLLTLDPVHHLGIAALVYVPPAGLALWQWVAARRRR